ncbi:hypothetical protein ISCGN_001490 [Ixodes scapularis]
MPPLSAEQHGPRGTRGPGLLSTAFPTSPGLRSQRRSPLQRRAPEARSAHEAPCDASCRRCAAAQRARPDSSPNLGAGEICVAPMGRAGKGDTDTSARTPRIGASAAREMRSCDSKAVEERRSGRAHPGRAARSCCCLGSCKNECVH